MSSAHKQKGIPTGLLFVASTTAIVIVTGTFALFRLRRRGEKVSDNTHDDENVVCEFRGGTLECVCRKVQMKVSLGNGAVDKPVHIICYCDDCQEYERYCRKLRMKDEQQQHSLFRRVSDKHGGIRVCEVMNHELDIMKGRELLRPTSLKKPGGIVWRFHTECCKTPMIAGSFRDFGIPQVGFFVSNLLLPFELDGGGKNDDNNGCTTNEDDNNKPYYCVASIYMKNTIDDLNEDDIDFDWDSECRSGLPQPVDYRFHTRYAKNHPETMRPGGSKGIPGGFLLGFLWRNVIRRNLPSWIATNQAPPLSPDSILPFPKKGDEIFRDVFS